MADYNIRKNKNLLWIGIIVIIAIVVVVIFINSYSKETKFVCSDGSLVSNKDLCPKQNTATSTETTTGSETAPKVTSEKVIIYEKSGQIQQSETSAMLKQMSASGGGSYGANIYQGGAIELTFTASSSLNYVLTAGENCVTGGVGTITLKIGSIKDGSVLWSPTDTKPTELCIKLENTNFKDWSNINPITYSLVVKETQTE